MFIFEFLMLQLVFNFYAKIINFGGKKKILLVLQSGKETKRYSGVE